MFLAKFISTINTVYYRLFHGKMCSLVLYSTLFVKLCLTCLTQGSFMKNNIDWLRRIDTSSKFCWKLMTFISVFWWWFWCMVSCLNWIFSDCCILYDPNFRFCQQNSGYQLKLLYSLRWDVLSSLRNMLLLHNQWPCKLHFCVILIFKFTN